MKAITPDIKIFDSLDLKGLSGDNGETICLFFADRKNPLNSSWAWFHTVEAALNYVNEFKATEA